MQMCICFAFPLVLIHSIFVSVVGRQKCLTWELSLVFGKRSGKCSPVLCHQFGRDHYALYKSSGKDIHPFLPLPIFLILSKINQTSLIFLFCAFAVPLPPC